MENAELFKELQEQHVAIKQKDNDAAHAKKLIKTEWDKLDKSKKDHADKEAEVTALKAEAERHFAI